jgi:hypothetical protein
MVVLKSVFFLSPDSPKRSAMPNEIEGGNCSQAVNELNDEFINRFLEVGFF